MTKEEIKAAIAKGIAGQGTNVDGGGYLPKILDAIVDAIPEGGGNEPLVVEGSVDSTTYKFTPSSGQPSYADARNAFVSGRVVKLHFLLQGSADTFADISNTAEDGGGFGEYLCASFGEAINEDQFEKQICFWRK